MASVLVVDDEPDIRYLTQVNLELDGHRVMTAANGEEALAAVQVEVPDVVLLDVMMPGVDGWAVLEQLKSHLDDRIKSVKVLMMTALGADDDRLRGGIEGAVRYLVKPVTPDELRDAVAGVLAGGPEREQRLRAQTGALLELARLEKGTAPEAGEAPSPRLSRLEHARVRDEPAADDEVRRVGAELTEKQVALLRSLLAAPSVSAAAGDLGVSRSNVYASLRRIARKLGHDDVPELLRRLRAGQLVVDDLA
ncbi:MAG TPA: response regulator [Acidimicrobiales bacterium]|nr:response regulator [Acidimicrobiales bacterium]